jgi:hypothetical protein
MEEIRRRRLIRLMFTMVVNRLAECMAFKATNKSETNDPPSIRFAQSSFHDPPGSIP